MTQKPARTCTPSTTPGQTHISVLAPEVMTALQPLPGGVYVDATFGDGGHSRAILQRIGPQGRLFALDRDRQAIQHNVALVREYPEQLIMVHTAFSRLKEVLSQQGIFAVQGILFDLGVSSRQLDEPERGFSFQADGPLDMRMDQAVDFYDPPIPNLLTPTTTGLQQRKPLTAATIVNTFGKEALVDIFFRFGEERHARRIAQAIVSDRQQQPFTTTRQLASLLERILPRNFGNNRKKGSSIHPATRVFQALRIAVNHEMEELQTGLTRALECLDSGGKVVVISFHSLEDRIVKHTFRQAANPLSAPVGPDILVQPTETTQLFRLLTRKPLLPGIEEIRYNPRSRSARLRAIERLPNLATVSGQTVSGPTVSGPTQPQAQHNLRSHASKHEESP